LAKIVQRPLAKQVRVALASFRKLDDFAGDYLDDEILSIRKSQGGACHFECDPHDTFCLGIEFVAVQEYRDGHVRLPATGGSATELSVTDAWADAAVGDVRASHIPGGVVCAVADRRGKLGHFIFQIRTEASELGQYPAGEQECSVKRERKKVAENGQCFSGRKE
jgi:hypothetical protein